MAIIITVSLLLCAGARLLPEHKARSGFWAYGFRVQAFRVFSGFGVRLGVGLGAQESKGLGLTGF